MDFNGEITPFILQWTVSAGVTLLFSLYYGYRSLSSDNRLIRLFFINTSLAFLATLFFSAPFYLTTDGGTLTITVIIGLLFAHALQFMTAYTAREIGIGPTKLRNTLFYAWIPFFLASLATNVYIIASNGTIDSSGTFAWQGSILVSILASIGSLPYAMMGLALIKLAEDITKKRARLAYRLFGVYLISISLGTAAETLTQQTFGDPSFQTARIIITITTGLVAVAVAIVSEIIHHSAPKDKDS